MLAVDEDHAEAERDVQGGPQVVDGALWEPALIEGLAQTAAVVNGHASSEGSADGPTKEGMLVGLRRFKVHGVVRDGQRVTYRVTLLKKLGPLTLFEAEARVGERVVAAGQMKFWVDEVS